MAKKTKSKAIWILDDDYATLDLLAEILGAEGYKVRIFTEGTELAQALSRSLPQLILLDLVMPMASGAVIATNLKSDPRTQRIPLILMSADSRIIDQQKQVSAEDVLSKPFDISNLLEKVEKYCS